MNVGATLIAAISVGAVSARWSNSGGDWQPNSMVGHQLPCGYSKPGVSKMVRGPFILQPSNYTGNRLPANEAVMSEGGRIDRPSEGV